MIIALWAIAGLLGLIALLLVVELVLLMGIDSTRLSLEAINRELRDIHQAIQHGGGATERTLERIRAEVVEQSSGVSHIVASLARIEDRDVFAEWRDGISGTLYEMLQELHSIEVELTSQRPMASDYIPPSGRVP